MLTWEGGFGNVSSLTLDILNIFFMGLDIPIPHNFSVRLAVLCKLEQGGFAILCCIKLGMGGFTPCRMHVVILRGKYPLFCLEAFQCNKGVTKLGGCVCHRAVTLLGSALIKLVYTGEDELLDCIAQVTTPG